MIDIKTIKEHIINIVKENEDVISINIDKIEYVPVDRSIIKKEVFKNRLWKRMGKKRINNETRRIFKFSESGLWIPPEYIGAKSIPSSKCKLSDFNIIIEIICDFKDNDILRHNILYIGEHPWEEDFIKNYL